VRIESFTDPSLKQDAEIQPDGTITLRLLNQVYAARTTVTQLQHEIERRYKQYYKQPAILVTPLKVDSKLEDLRSSIDLRYGYGGQSRQAKVTPEGSIQLPVVGSIPVQGLTLNELQTELEERFAAQIAALDITPVLLRRAPRYIYVVGEVPLPGRYELSGPTTVMQAISMAGGWNHGGNVWNTVIFRRGDDWRLMATKLDLRGSLYGHRPCPADEIWLNDSDIVLVPKTGILVAQNVIDLVFKQGVFKVVPFRLTAAYSTFRVSGVSPTVPLTPNIPTAPHIPVPVPSQQ
jgi:polysaccharide export outer membrane protein